MIKVFSFLLLFSHPISFYSLVVTSQISSISPIYSFIHSFLSFSFYANPKYDISHHKLIILLLKNSMTRLGSARLGPALYFRDHVILIRETIFSWSNKGNAEMKWGVLGITVFSLNLGNNGLIHFGIGFNQVPSGGYNQKNN